MQKLLAAYRAAPTLKNAQRIRNYERAHKMALCLLARESADLVADAIRHANFGHPQITGIKFVVGGVE